MEFLKGGFGSKCRSGLMKYVDDTKLEGNVDSEDQNTMQRELDEMTEVIEME